MQDVSATVAFLRSGNISILHAIAAELPDVFSAEVLPRLNLQDTVNLAQTSKLFRDSVWSVRGVQSMRAKIGAHIKAITEYNTPRRCNIPYSILDPLALAGYFGATRAVRALIAAGEEVDTRKTLKGQTTLHLAVEQRKRSVVDLLLDAGADTNIQDNAGRTVLHLAVDQRDGSLIDALLDAGADGNIKDKEGRTALHVAAASFRRTNVPENVSRCIQIRRDGSVFEHILAKANNQSLK